MTLGLIWEEILTIKKRGVRQSNFELLRIIAMFLIVLHHAMVHGTLTVSGNSVLKTGNPLTFGIYNFFAFGGKVGVYIFVLITGYFMINSKIALKKVVKLWLPIFFWSIMVTLSYEVVKHDFSIGKIIQSALPIFFNQYWFMTVYFFLYLLIPLINEAIRNFSIKQELWCITLGLVIMFPNNFFYGSVVGGQLVNFVVVYFIGAFIREHDLLQEKQFKFLSTWSCWLSVILIFITAFGFSFIGFSLKSVRLLKAASFFTDGLTETFFCLFIALGLFAWIGSKKIGYHKFINTVATTTFGIYLIHDNGLMRALLWIKVFHMENLIRTPIYGVMYVLIVVLIVFVSCSLLEFIRKLIFSKFENKIASKSNIFGIKALNWLFAIEHIEWFSK